MEIDRNGMEVLTRADALRLLHSVPIGRVIVTVGALPAAFPVNFALFDDDVVFATGPGTKLAAAVHNAVVAFEADGFEAVDHTGWSVLIQGRTAEFVDPPAHLVDRLGTWLPAGPSAVVRIASEIVAGRRLSLEGARRYRQHLTPAQ